MIVYKRGSLFESNASYYGHGVNLQGVMGAGIAKAFREAYPNNYARYRTKCLTGGLKLGRAFVYSDTSILDRKPRIIVNLATQVYPGPDASVPAIGAALSRFTTRAKMRLQTHPQDHTIALPRIGCGIGGLQWEDVLPTIESVAAQTPDITYEIWEL